MASHVFGFIQRARAKLSTESRTPAFTVGTARAHASRRALLELYFEDRRGAELGVVLPVQANPAGTSPPGWGWVRRRSAGSAASFEKGPLDGWVAPDGWSELSKYGTKGRTGVLPSISK